MFKILGEIIKKRTKSLNLDKGIQEQVILSITEDYLKQENLFLCFPKSFINQELTLECSKAVMAEEINDQKDKMMAFLYESCPDITVKNIKTIIRPN